MLDLESILVSAVTAFGVLIFLALFGLLNLNIKHESPTWVPPPPPDPLRGLGIRNADDIAAANELSALSPDRLFPPRNRYTRVITKAYKLFNEAINGTERDGWVYLGDKKGVKRYKKAVIGSKLAMFRGEKILNYPVNILIAATKEPSVRCAINQDLAECGPMETIDDWTAVQFEHYKTPAPLIGAREFVYILCKHRLADGTIFTFGRTIEHDKMPITRKYVRATLHIGGWAFKPVPEEPNKTKAIYMIKADLMGSLPSWLINMVSEMIPMTVEELNIHLKKVGTSQFNQPLPAILDPSQTRPMSGGGVGMDESKSNGPSKSQSLLDGRDPSVKSGFASTSSLYRQDDEEVDRMQFFQSKHYTAMIPKDQQWIYRPLHPYDTSRDYVAEFHTIPDRDHQYSHDIEEGLKTFHIWRQWKNGIQWRERSIKSDLKIYSHSVPDEAIDIIKGTAIAPYNSAVFAGIILNPDHRMKWDEKLESINIINHLSLYSITAYISVKTPFFITYRDMVAVVFVYFFPDGQLLVGSKSVEHPSCPPKSTRVRATITLAMWHMKPDAMRPKTHTEVTYYSHVKLGGSLPEWIVNEASVDIPSSVSKVINYMQGIHHTLHLPGVLGVPVLGLGMLGCPIPENFMKIMLSESDKFGWDTGAIFGDGSGAPATPQDESEEKHAVVSTITTPRSRKSSGSGRQTSRPNGMLSSHGESESDHSSNRALIKINRDEWMLGATIRLEELPCTMSGTDTRRNSSVGATTSYDSASSTLRHRTNAQSPNSVTSANTESSRIKDPSRNLHGPQSNTAMDMNLASPRGVSIPTSVRDAASYITLANCAVSHLLQEADPTSKQYWVPTDMTTPRGIFVYKFIHSQKNYHHYMGKAILHHEPKFIWDALTEPSFRFHYDKMMDTMEIVERLDDSTYVGRMIHESRQCYVKTTRESILSIKHRVVQPNEKYVVAGVSVEHPSHPTANQFEVTRKESVRREEDTSEVPSQSGSRSVAGEGVGSKGSVSGLLRLDVKSSGWVIERNLKKPTDSIVSYITNANIGGMVPTAIQKQLAKKQPLAIFHLGRALKKREKKLMRRLQKQNSAKSVDTAATPTPKS